MANHTSNGSVRLPSAPRNVELITKDQPFCAGVILFQDQNLVITLNTDGLPASLEGSGALRIGAIGGGQEAGELIWQCALREDKHLRNGLNIWRGRVTHPAVARDLDFPFTPPEQILAEA